jgi:hypothetical protein
MEASEEDRFQIEAELLMARAGHGSRNEGNTLLKRRPPPSACARCGHLFKNAQR